MPPAIWLAASEIFTSNKRLLFVLKATGTQFPCAFEWKMSSFKYPDFERDQNERRTDAIKNSFNGKQ